MSKTLQKLRKKYSRKLKLRRRKIKQRGGGRRKRRKNEKIELKEKVEREKGRKIGEDEGEIVVWW